MKTVKTEYPFGRAFQEIAVALLFKKAPSFVLKTLLQDKHIEKQPHKILVLIFRQLQKKFPEGVTLLMMRDRIKKDARFNREEQIFLIKELKTCHFFYVSKTDQSYVEQELATFVQYQEVIHVLNEESVALLERKQLPLLKEKLDRAFTPVREETNSLRYFKDYRTRFKTRFKKRRAKTIKTLIPEIDGVLKGRGVQFGSLNVVIGATGAGKSMLLAYLAKAGVIQKKKVLYVTLQLLEDDIAERMDANFSGLTIFDAAEQIGKVIDVIEKKEALYGDNLRIKFFPAMKLTVRGLRDYLESEKQINQFIPELLIIDYGDLLIGEVLEASGGRYYESGAVFDELLGLAQEKNLVLWTASQAGRGAMSATLLTLEHIAESFRKVMAAQLVVTITRSVEEKKEEKCRLYVAKNSFGRDDHLFTVKTNYSKGSFYSSTPDEAP